MAPIPVSGYCPMGCGETLILSKGHVMCAWSQCPDPSVIDLILHESETEHVVWFDEKGFTIQHPLKDRREGLDNCPIHTDLRNLDDMPVDEPGRYRATRHQPDGYSESYRSGAVGWDFDKL